MCSVWLALCHNLTSDLVANLFMHSFPGIILLYLSLQPAPGFLKLFLCGRLYVCACPEATNNKWHDMASIQLVK